MLETKQKYILLCCKSILAGVLIAFAGIAFLMAPDKIIGAFLFSLGLIAVLVLDANLFTGKIGYVNNLEKAMQSAIILAVNLATAILVGVIYKFTFNTESAVALMEGRIQILNTNVGATFIRAFGCGVCIYLGVEIYKKINNVIPVIISIMFFILAGFYHCVADAFYWAASGFPLAGLWHLLLVIIGNSLGSLVIRGLQLGFISNKEAKN